MEKDIIQKFEQILDQEDKILDEVLENQKLLHKAVSEKKWEPLKDLISTINLLSEDFQKIDLCRDEIQSQLKTDELKPYFEKISSLRSKLLKSKVENQALEKFISVTRGFVQGIIDTVIPRGNKVYTKKGIVQNQPQSVVLSVTM